MAKKSILKHGFKSNCEKQAIELRKSLEIGLWEPICAFELAKHLEIPIFKATEFIKSESDLKLLSGSNQKPCEWSALTMITKAGNRIIIHNPFASKGRQQSDLMHEIAHVMCKHEHKIREIPINLPFGLRDFDSVQEEEAKCLGSTLQLPRESLLWARKKKMNLQEIAEHFNSSVDMARYRLNTTGVDRQLALRKKNYGY